jgi:hypothetical protein
VPSLRLSLWQSAYTHFFSWVWVFIALLLVTGYADLYLRFGGFAGSVLRGLFSQGLISGSQKLKNVATQHPYSLALICSLVIAVIGLLTQTSINGTGYDAGRYRHLDAR